MTVKASSSSSSSSFSSSGAGMISCRKWAKIKISSTLQFFFLTKMISNILASCQFELFLCFVMTHTLTTKGNIDSSTKGRAG